MIGRYVSLLVVLTVAYSSMFMCAVASGDANVDPVVMTTAGPQENNSEVLFAEGSHFSCCIESINGTLWLTWNGSKLLNSSSSVMMISSPDCVNISLQSTPLLGRLCCVATDDEDMSTLSKCINIVDRKAPYEVALKVVPHYIALPGGDNVVAFPRNFDLSVECTVPSDVLPLPHFSWTQDGSTVQGNMTSNHSSVLTSSNLTSYTNITCEVTNSEGSKRSRLEVVPKTPLKVSIPQDKVVIETDSKTLYCNYSSFNNVSIVWRRVGSTDIFGSESSLQLSINSSPGRYFCQVTDNALEISETDYIDVVVQERAVIQRVFGEVANCQYLEIPQLDSVGRDLVQALITTVQEQCNCGFGEENVLSESTTFSCYPDGHRAALLRTELLYKSTNATNNMLHILTILRGVGSLEINGRRYPVVQSCPLELMELNESLCPLEREHVFEITLNMVYSFAIGLGFALLLCICLFLFCCCIVRCCHRAETRKQKRRAVERKPIIELIRPERGEPPEPLDPTLSIRTNTSWSSVLKAEQRTGSRHNLNTSRESLRSDNEELMSASKELNSHKRQFSGDDSPDSGLILHSGGTRTSMMESNNSLKGALSGLQTYPHGGDHSNRMSDSLEELANGLDSHHSAVTMETAANVPLHLAPVSRSMQHLTQYGGEDGSSPSIIPRDQVKSETLNTTATDEMMQLIEEVRAARAAFQQILDKTPEGSPVPERGLGRHQTRSQSFREPRPHNRPKKELHHHDDLHFSDPNFIKSMSMRTARSPNTVDGNNASTNAYWIEKLRVARDKRSASPPAVPDKAQPRKPTRSAGSYGQEEYDALEPISSTFTGNHMTSQSPGFKRKDNQAHNHISPLATSYHGVNDDVFPPPPPPETAHATDTEVAGGPVFVPIPMAPMASPFGSTSPNGPIPPPPPPPLPQKTLVPPPVPAKKSARPSSMSSLETSQPLSHQAHLKDVLTKIHNAKAAKDDSFTDQNNSSIPLREIIKTKNM